MSDQSIKAPSTQNKLFNPSLDYVGSRIKVIFNKDCLKQERLDFRYAKTTNIYIVYEINKIVNISSYPVLENCFFGVVKLAKHVDIDQYKYSGYGIGYERKGFFSIGYNIGRNVIIFGVDMSSSTKIDNRKKDILILGKGPTQGLEYTFRAEKFYLINFTNHFTKFCLSLHYNGANSSKFKAKGSEINPYELCLGNISKVWSIDNMKTTGFNGYIYDFSVDFDYISISDILDIHKYLMENNGIV